MEPVVILEEHAPSIAPFCPEEGESMIFAEYSHISSKMHMPGGNNIPVTSYLFKIRFNVIPSS
jgi:hypothetical protein